MTFPNFLSCLAALGEDQGVEAEELCCVTAQQNVWTHIKQAAENVDAEATRTSVTTTTVESGCLRQGTRAFQR